jgi:O-antigen/teichoic acid export membrane protein
VGVARQAIVLSLSRVANYGLMLVSPVILVRLLSVEQFGQYREFLLYGGILQNIASFAIPECLLYLIAAHPHSPWRVVRCSAALTLAISTTVVLVLIAVDLATHGSLVGRYLWPVAAYTLLAVNLDFWEFFWVARGRPAAVFAYSAARLIARLATAVAAAAVTRSVAAIIWAIVACEGVRLLASAAAWSLLDRGASEPRLVNPWRELLGFCMPTGAASMLAMLSRNVSNIAVVKWLGSAALAQYSIGRFGEPVVVTVRNSISSVVLPEMVSRGQLSRERSLDLWRRATVVNTLFLLPIAVLVARYAHPAVALVFGPQYGEAALVMQLYMIVVVRECFDFSPAVQAAGRTTPLAASNTASFLACAALLAALVPIWGVAGAMVAFAAASWIGAAVLARSTLTTYGMRLADLLPWGRLARVGAACAIAAPALLDVRLDGMPTLVSCGLEALVFTGIYALALHLLGVPEALHVFGLARHAVRGRAVRRV